MDARRTAVIALSWGLLASPASAEVAQLRVVSAGFAAAPPAAPAPAEPIGELVTIRRDPRCGQDPRAATFFASAVDQGLERLAAWDGAAARRLRSRARGGVIVLGCQDEEREGAEGSHARGGGWMRRESRIVVADLDQAAAAPEGRLADAARRVAFHEFLHFAGVESLPEHGRGLSMDRRQLDRVFSCDALAFPESGYVARAPDGRGLPVTRRSCETCLGSGHPRCEAL